MKAWKLKNNGQSCACLTDLDLWDPIYILRASQCFWSGSRLCIDCILLGENCQHVGNTNWELYVMCVLKNKWGLMLSRQGSFILRKRALSLRLLSSYVKSLRGRFHQLQTVSLTYEHERTEKVKSKLQVKSHRYENHLIYFLSGWFSLKSTFEVAW